MRRVRYSSGQQQCNILMTVVTGHVSLFAAFYQRIFKKISGSNITGSSVNIVTATGRTTGFRCTEWKGDFPDTRFHNPM